MIQNEWTLKTCCTEDTSHKRPHSIQRHSQECPGQGNYRRKADKSWVRAGVGRGKRESDGECRISPRGGESVTQLTVVIFAQSREPAGNKCIWRVNHGSTKLLPKAPPSSSGGNVGACSHFLLPCLCLYVKKKNYLSLLQLPGVNFNFKVICIFLTIVFVY